MEQFKTRANTQPTEIINEQPVAQVTNTPAKAKDGYFIFGSHKEASDYMKAQNLHKLYDLEDKHWPLSRLLDKLDKKEDYNLDDEEPVRLGRTGIYSAPYAYVDDMRGKRIEGIRILPYYYRDVLHFCIQGAPNYKEGRWGYLHILPEWVVDEYAKSCNLSNKDRMSTAAYYLRRFERYYAGECNWREEDDEDSFYTAFGGRDGITMTVENSESDDNIMFLSFDDRAKLDKEAMTQEEIFDAIKSYLYEIGF